MKKCFLFLFTLFLLNSSFAQKERDSLLSTWNQFNLPDSARYYAMIDLVEDYYLYRKPDSALILSKEMLALSMNQKNVPFQMESHFLLGTVYFELNEITLGEESYTRGLDMALQSKDSLLYGDKLLRLGRLYYDYDIYTKAFTTFKKVQEYSSKINDKFIEGWSIAYQGFIYSALGNYKEAEKCHLEHLRLSKIIGNQRSISGANGNLGSVYNRLGNIPKSLEYWSEGIRISKEIGLPEYASVGTGNVIDIYIKEKEYEEATKYLQEYSIVTKQFDFPRYTRSFEHNIHLWQCKIDYGLEKYSKALKECKSCLAILNTNGWQPNATLLEKIYQIYKALGQYQLALEYYEKAQVLLDDDKKNQARTEIQNIDFTNQMKVDSMDQARERELLNASYEEGLARKNREKNVFLGIGLFIMLVAIAYYFISRRIDASERNRLEEINRLKNTLFTNITHEFRTPLMVIKGMADMIKSNANGNQSLEFEKSIEMIERNSDGLLHLVNEMLDLSRIEAGHMEVQLKQSDVIPFLKYIGESFHSLAEDKQVQLVIYSEMDSLIMDYDSKKLSSIMTNLLSNAIKFTQEFGKIIVHIYQVSLKGEPFLAIKIKDNGIGISPEALPQIFNRFYQTDSSTIRKHEGTGIGLALTKELVELLGGTIDVNSTLDKGSEFLFMIPISQRAEKATENPIQSHTIPVMESAVVIENEAIHEAGDEKPLVLIIEDNEDVTYYLQKCLELQYNTIHSINGIEGIEMAFEKVPDIIISDVMMPDKDGYEVCRVLKMDERTDHIPIILLTAKATIEDRLQGLSFGADAYLAKPFVKEELFTRLDQLVAIRNKLIKKVKEESFSELLLKRTQNPKVKFLQKIINLIHKEIDNSSFGSKSLANKLMISESQVYKKIKAITGKSTAVYIRSIRLQYALKLLKKTDKTVSEVAYASGFNDPSWFSRVFKEEFGFSPSEAEKI